MTPRWPGPLDRAYWHVAREFAAGRLSARDVDRMQPAIEAIAPALFNHAGGAGLGESRRERERERDRTPTNFGMVLLGMSTSMDSAEMPRVQKPPTPANEVLLLGGFDSAKNHVVEPFYVDIAGTFLEGGEYIDITIVDATLDIGAGLFLDELYGDCECEQTTFAATAGACVYARFTPDYTFNVYAGYQCVYEGTAIRVYTWDPFLGPSLLTTQLGSLNAGDSFGLRCQGTNISVLINGVVVKTVVDASWSTGRMGFGGSIAGTKISGFRWAGL